MTTNRGKVNKTSNEELARIIDNTDRSCDFCVYANVSSEKICSKSRERKCKDGILQWLNQESR